MLVVVRSTLIFARLKKRISNNSVGIKNKNRSDTVAKAVVPVSFTARRHTPVAITNFESGRDTYRVSNVNELTVTILALLCSNKVTIHGDRTKLKMVIMATNMAAIPMEN